jgi:asparagine synthase (glutamine-hydrolysing)
MCGIAGFLAPRTSASPSEVVRRMSAALAHRGPDDAGHAVLRGDDGAAAGAFGHTRLAIIDLSSAGHQPMCDPVGRYTILFNGEIYNYRALRAELAASFQFRSDSDTEVIIAGWARDGIAFLRRLRGMFALAIWDAHSQTLVLARDRFGIKPLYYAERDGELLFASELRALLASERLPRRLNAKSIAGYLATGAMPEPDTAIEGVRSLPAGHALVIRRLPKGLSLDGPQEFASVLEPSAGHAEVHGRGARGIVRDALRDSVAHHMVSDVPVALFLSGGIDSSIIAALAAEQGGSGLDAFTMVFDERRFDESRPAAAVARRFGMRQHEIPLTAESLAAALPAAFGAMDQPSLDGINTFLISRAVSDAGYKVVLSGLGGDELFAGYPSFRRARRLARLGRHASSLLRASTPLLGSGARAQKLALLFAELDPARDAYVASRTLFPPTTRRSLLAVEPTGTPPAPARLSLLQASSWFELTGYMRNTLLRDSDVFSMASGLELRVPFVDSEVAAASLRVHDALKIERGYGKAILIEAFSDMLPASVWNRPKQGFTLPFENWLRGPLASEIARALGDRRRLERLGLDPIAVWETWSRYSSGRGHMSWSRPWSLYTLLLWAERIDASVSGNASSALVTAGAA